MDTSLRRVMWYAFTTLFFLVPFIKQDVILYNAALSTLTESTVHQMCTVFLAILIISFSFLQWSFGVTMWEIFSGGKSPFPGMDPFSLMQSLEKGERLSASNNTACTEDM